MKRTGRIWCFGDNIDTDLIYPGTAFRATPAERAALVFSANRPGWSAQVQPGDLIVAGRNFGTGSGRAASTVLVDLGIAGIVAETVNGLFLRSCINAGLPATECPSIMTAVEEGDVIEVDFAKGTVKLADERLISAQALPSALIEILEAGGILPQLARQGYIKP
jgi:3-isopropylmalate/(R)-2-methylmalate dehydratase small subunit